MENKEILQNKEVVEKKSILQKDLSLKEILIVVGAFVLIIGYGVIFILPRYNEYKSSVSKLEQVQQQITTYESDISTLPVLEKQLSSLNKEIEVEKRKLSHNMEDGMFLVGLSNLINSLGVDLVSYTVEETITYNSFYAIPTSIEVRGNYNYIRRIMSYLEEQKNTTQILDYNMETYIEEETDDTELQNQVNSGIVSDSVVYWTEDGSQYHKSSCSALTVEQHQHGGEIFNGSVDASEKTSPCEVCKPYTLEETQVVENVEPKATGEIVAKFKFVMYSTENPKYGLDVENNNDWQPGKFNPFKTTTR